MIIPPFEPLTPVTPVMMPITPSMVNDPNAATQVAAVINAAVAARHEGQADHKNNVTKIEENRGFAGFLKTRVGQAMIGVLVIVIPLAADALISRLSGKPVDVQKVATDPALIESLKELKEAMLKSGPVSVAVPVPKTDKQRIAELEAYIEATKTKQVAPNNIPDVTAKPKQ